MKKSEWTREDWHFLSGFLLLLVVCLALAVLARVAFGDEFPTPASPIPPRILAMRGWAVYAQSVDAVTGAPIGAPRKVAPKKGLYRTVQQCSKSENGRIARAHNDGVRWIATIWYCHHEEPPQKGSGVV